MRVCACNSSPRTMFCSLGPGHMMIILRMWNTNLKVSSEMWDVLFLYAQDANTVPMFTSQHAYSLLILH